MLYEGQKFYRVNVFGLTRDLPIVPIDNGLWIASDAELVLGDVEFIDVAGREIAETIKRFSPSVIVTAEAKAITIAYEIAKNLGHKRFVIARKSVKGYMKEYIVENVKSITTKEQQILVLTREDANLVKNQRICIFDDVVSTGGTINALENLVKKAGGNIVCKVCIWKEGPWYKSQDLIYFSILPIFVSKNIYEEYVKNIRA